MKMPKNNQVPTKPEIIIANLHRRFSGVTATILNLAPYFQHKNNIAYLDSSASGLNPTISLKRLFLIGLQYKKQNKPPILHLRRNHEMILALILRMLFRQKWQLIFTSAAPKPYNLFNSALVKRMDYVIAACNRAANFLEKHDAIIPHGVDTETFTPINERSFAHSKVYKNNFSSTNSGAHNTKNEANPINLSVNKESFLISTAGRVRYSKGIDVFVDAMINLLPKHPNWYALIVGECKAKDKKYQDALQQRIVEHGLADRIKFTGRRKFDEVVEIYQQTSIYCSFSRREGFGLTPFEAMSCGSVAVTTDEGEWSNAFAEKEFAKFVSKDDVEGATKAIEHFITNKRNLNSLGAIARSYTTDNYSIKKEAKQLLEVYEGLLSDY